MENPEICHRCGKEITDTQESFLEIGWEDLPVDQDYKIAHWACAFPDKQNPLDDKE